MASFAVTPEQMEWCRRVSRRGTDYPLDRDDLFSFALESLWIAWSLRPLDLAAMAQVIFDNSRKQLLRQYFARKRGALRRASRVVNWRTIVDPVSLDPALQAEMAEGLGRQWEGVPCRLCGTTGGRGGPGSPRRPKRIKGLCICCDRRRRRLDGDARRGAGTRLGDECTA
jgi:hypothetical protein